MAAAERITPGQIKKTNRQLIYDYIYQRKKVSQQDIAYALRLSRPTVASNLSEMEEAGLVRKNGQLDQDQIGRKAMAYSVVPDYRIDDRSRTDGARRQGDRGRPLWSRHGSDSAAHPV